jgi:2-isopropylmalate synthase
LSGPVPAAGSSDRPRRARQGAHEHRAGGAHVDLDVTGLPRAVEIYDTTLRDGSQQEGISLSVEDKLRVAEQLDHLGVSYIEGGWPGSNPKDEEFFARAPFELKLEKAKLVAFGSTRRAGIAAGNDTTLRHLVDAGTETVCIVAKSSALHVTEALRTSLDEGVEMVRDSIEFLRAAGREVFLDAEHFFDGYLADREFSYRVLDAAERAGAATLVLCDTNGGMLPDQVAEVVADVRQRTSSVVGVHFHNDTGCAVANSLAAVREGAGQVQGCVNGYGERAGNADLCATIPNLSLKMGIETIPRERIVLVTPVSHHVAEIVNLSLDPQKPYVGVAAFTHKAGLHTSAIARRRDAYEHVPPDSVGNGTRVVVSELAGRSTLEMKANELGIELGSEAVTKVLDSLKQLEYDGYHFEVADGSLELLMRAAAAKDGGQFARYFSIESFRVITDWRAAETDAAAERLVHPWSKPGTLTTEATVKVNIGDERLVATAEGNGPVNALDGAVRQAIGPYFSELAAMRLTDYRVRVLDTQQGSAAVTRVLLDLTDEEGVFSTMGVSENIIEASWQALVDAIVYGLLRAGARPEAAGPGVEAK